MALWPRQAVVTAFGQGDHDIVHNAEINFDLTWFVDVDGVDNIIITTSDEYPEECQLATHGLQVCKWR